MCIRVETLHEAYRNAYSTIYRKLNEAEYERFKGNYELVIDFLDEAFWCDKKFDAVKKIVQAYRYVPRADGETRDALVWLIIAIARGDEYGF